MTFSAQLWAAGSATYAAILDHPFITGLTSGTLSRDAFRYFLIQDSHYLRAYARTLALTGARATTDEAVRMFSAHAADAIAVEQELHTELLGSLGIDPTEVDRTPVGPATMAYTSYLLAVCSTGSYAEAVATVLPCYWVYRDVGRELLVRSSPDPTYAAWIATYSSPEFDAVVSAVIAETDRLGDETSDAEQARCAQHFATTTRYEWMFWDAAYHQLDWPI